MNIAVTILAISFCLMALVKNRYILSFILLSSGALLTFKSIILVVAIYRIKTFVDTIEFAMPNKCLMMMHFSNVTVYTILLIASAVFNNRFQLASEGSEQKAKYFCAFSLALTFLGIFSFYNVLFIFTLLLKQTKKRE